MGLLPLPLHLEVVRFLPLSWITSALVAAACNAGHQELYYALIRAPDRCHACNQVIYQDSPCALRVEPCGCLVHAPCALDDVIETMLWGVIRMMKPALWHSCPRCSMPRCTNLESWFQTMCLIDPRLFFQL